MLLFWGIFSVAAAYASEAPPIDVQLPKIREPQEVELAPRRALGDAVSMMSITKTFRKMENPNFKCNDCCMDGYKQVPCLDVESCAAKGPKKGKYAFVLSQRCAPPWTLPNPATFLKNIEAMKAQAQVHGIDMLMLMRPTDIAAMPKKMLTQMKDHNVRLVPVDWDLPPGMKYKPANWTGNRGWCGPMDLIRLHMFNLTGYDAVVYYDDDIELRADVTPILRCAATGRMLTTTGPMAPINVGFMAVRPDPRFLKAAVAFAQNASYDHETGWAGGGFRPAWDKYVGAECGQGLLHTLFYKAHKNVLARRCLEYAGLKPEQIGVTQVSGCIWNYQGREQCGKSPEKFNCSHIKVHHKPKSPEEGSCMKFIEQREAASRM